MPSPAAWRAPLSRALVRTTLLIGFASTLPASAATQDPRDAMASSLDCLLSLPYSGGSVGWGQAIGASELQVTGGP